MDVHLMQRIAACPTLPSVPAIALEVVRLFQADEVDLRSLGPTLNKDPDVTVEFLCARDVVGRHGGDALVVLLSETVAPQEAKP